MKDNNCPCCESILKKTDINYQLLDILTKWEGHGLKISPNTWKDYSDNTIVTLYLCNNCGYGVFLPMKTGSANFYTDITLEDYYLNDRWDFHIAIDLLKSLEAKSVLDVGCGQGAFLREVFKGLPSIKCFGSDSNPTIVDKLPSNVVHFKSLDDAPVNLDVVTLFQVIEHVSDPVGLIKESVTKLRPGGFVVVSVPDHTGPIRFFSDSHTAIPPHHVSIWTPASLDALMGKMGLSVVERKFEPLPNYLMSAYLPKIISNKLGILGNEILEILVQRFIANPLVWLCNLFHIKSLPTKGHTYLVVAQKSIRIGE